MATFQPSDDLNPGQLMTVLLELLASSKMTDEEKESYLNTLDKELKIDVLGMVLKNSTVESRDAFVKVIKSNNPELFLDTLENEARQSV